MKILITGAGLIGCYTAAELLQQGHRVWFYDIAPDAGYIEAVAGKKSVRIIQGDILDLPSILRALKAVKPAVVVHTAGFIGGQVAKAPYRGVQTNIIGSTHIFEACRLAGIKRVVHVSSFSVYDWANIHRGPVKENFPRWGSNFYQATKIANELIFNEYQKAYGFEGVVLRPAGVYGPGHYRGGSSGGINVNALVRACLDTGPIAIYEKRIGRNDFVYAGDVGRGVALGCTVQKAQGKVFNIGSGKIYDSADFVRVLQRLFPKREIRIVKDEDKNRQGHKRIRLDLTRAKQILGYAPRYSLEKGLRDYLEVSRNFGFWD